MLRAELAPDELVGLDALRGFGDAGSTASSIRRPSSTRASRSGSQRRGGRTTLSLDLPFADRDDLELGRRGDELLVRVGPYRRAVTLPDSLRRRPVADASLKGGTLKVVFEGNGNDG